MLTIRAFILSDSNKKHVQGLIGEKSNLPERLRFCNRKVIFSGESCDITSVSVIGQDARDLEKSREDFVDQGVDSQMSSDFLVSHFAKTDHNNDANHHTGKLAMS